MMKHQLKSREEAAREYLRRCVQRDIERKSDADRAIEWLANIIIEEKNKTNLPIVILGKTFKKETNLTVGSPSILLRNILEEKGIEVLMYDPWIDDTNPPIIDSSIFFIGTNHDLFLNYKFPKGSVVIDPWRYLNKEDGIKLIKIGDSLYE